MSILKIPEAIKEHNDKLERGEPKMTPKSLGECIMKNNGSHYLSRWKYNKGFSYFKPEHLIRICLKTGVDPNFIYDWEVVKHFNEEQLKEYFKNK